MASQDFQKVTHVIFDVDGLLLDTERLYTVAIKQVVAEYGAEYTWELKVRCMGQIGSVGAQMIIDELKLPLTVEEYMKKVNKQYEIVFPTSSLLPGAEKLVRHLKANGVPIAIASGGSEASFQLKTTRHREFFELFNHRVMASSDPEVKKGKPAPDVFAICAQRFPEPAKAEQCLVFEDAPNGVEASAAAGMQTVMVPDPRLDAALTKKATLVLSSLEDFNPAQFGLPAYS